jgi:hypothetical protein
MDCLAINDTDMIKNVIDRYRIWKDSNNFRLGLAEPYQIVDDPNGVPCFHYTNVKQINQCTSPVVVIECLTEGIHSIDYFKQYRTDCCYIIFSNGWWDIEKYNLPFEYKLVWHLFVLFDMCDTYSSPNRFCYYSDRDYKFDYPKSCIFVSTIGNKRKERTWLINRLVNNLNYKNFILRYSGQDLAMPSNQFDMVEFEVGQFDPYTPLIEKYYHTVSQTIPIELYNQGYFNLVVETDLSLDNEFFLTEKTIKLLITGQPFVVVSTLNFLKHLRKLGFRTYESIWSEDYDQIEDYKDRVDAITELCNHLATIDWESHKSQLIEIQKHNQLAFTQMSHIVNQEFTRLETIIQEL